MTAVAARRGGRRLDLATLAAETVAADPTAQSDGAAAPTLPIAEIASNPLNAREDADMMGEEFDQLVATIREHGVLQPIVVCAATAFLERYPDQDADVRPSRWVALIGNRRLLASREAGLDRVPAIVNDDRATTMHEVMLVENAHRRDLGPIREAEAMRQVLEEQKISTRELGDRIGRSHVYIVHRLALLGLIPALRRAFEGGQIKLELARQLGKLPVPDQEAIEAAAPPYRARRPSSAGNGATSRRRPPSVATPAKAAESVRDLFTPDELAELVRLLTDDT